jgi:hypothetical protein
VFAGRYVWWMLMAVTAFLFFAVYYPHVVWFFAALTECSATPEGCAGQSAFFSGFLKPVGLTMTALLVLGCSAARVLYLRLAPAWIAAIGIWFAASAGKLLTIASLWSGAPRPATLIEVMPQQLVFLFVLLVFLAFPLESFREARHPLWRVASSLAGLAAVWSCLVAIAGLEALPTLLFRLLDPAIAAPIAAELEAISGFLANPGGRFADPLPGLFIAYAGVLALFLVCRRRPALSAPAPQPVEKPKRRHHPVPVRQAR